MDRFAIKRLENNHYALDKAYERLKESIESNHDPEIYAATGELLLWVIAIDEWHRLESQKVYEDKRDNDADGVLLTGMRFAVNLIKHSMDFIQIHHKKGGFTFPATYPIIFNEIKVIWVEANNLPKSKYEKPKGKYINTIEGKEVLSTFDQAINFLRQESQRYRSR